METLLKQAVSDDDIKAIQCFFGLCLLGVNMSQIIVILSGNSGTGKGTIVRVLCGVVGMRNVASLRTQQLAERFELGSLIGKTLLYGADVFPDFLNHKSAAVLKALTGGDPLTVEVKNSNNRPELQGVFNVIITANSKLLVKLEGDNQAWRRRLIVIPFSREKPARAIANLSEHILKEEAPGVLNWSLEGLQMLKSNQWQFHLSESQRSEVDNLISESDSPKLFVKEWLAVDPNSRMTTCEVYAKYVKFCKSRGWVPFPRVRVGSIIENAIANEFSLPLVNSIIDDNGKAQRGWVGLTCRDPAPDSTNGAGGLDPAGPSLDKTDTISKLNPQKEENVLLKGLEASRPSCPSPLPSGELSKVNKFAETRPADPETTPGPPGAPPFDSQTKPTL
jgi:P4 family phage/plasmid primase-like protien